MPTGFWMFSVHLPSKMDIWQVSAYSLQAPPLTGLTLTGQCHLHKFLSLLPLLDPTQLLTYSRYKSLPLSCSPPGTISPVKMWLSRTRCIVPPPGSSPVTVSQRWPIFPLSRPPPTMGWCGQRTHLSLYSRQLVLLLKWDETFTLWFLEKKEEKSVARAPCLRTAESQKASREGIWWTCPSLTSSPLMNSIICFPLLQKYLSRGSHIPLYSSTIFCNHNCFPNCIESPWRQSQIWFTPAMSTSTPGTRWTWSILDI